MGFEEPVLFGKRFGLIALLWLTASQNPVESWADAGEAKVLKPAPAVASKAEPFPLRDIRLLDGPFRHAMELDHAYLLSLEPDRLLHSFRLNAGLRSVAKPYGGWMSPGHTGCAEFVGHYLSACALMYASTGDERLRANANQVVAGLGQCQDRLGTGYLHTKADNFTSRAEAPLGLWYQIHKTGFPDEGRTRLVVNCEKPVELRLNIRHPYWAASGFEIKVNGASQPDDSTPGSYAVVGRKWQSGDTVEVAIPFRLQTEGFRDNPSRVAVMYGPLVLCAETGAGPAEAPYPALIGTPGNLDSVLEPIPGRPCMFRGPPQVLRLSEDPSRGPILEPLYRMHGNRTYVVYWNVFSSSAWPATEARARIRKARTVDRVLPGREQSEREHHLQSEKSGSDGNAWRDAWDGGWFSWDLKVLSGRPLELCVKYWGGDTGGREFDILSDGEKLATVKLDNNKPGEFDEEHYPIPERITRGKEKITVRFQAHPGKMAGGVFGCVILTLSPEDAATQRQ